MPALARPLALLAVAGCVAPADSGETATPDTGDAGIPAEEALYLPDGPGDLDLAADGRVLIATRWGSDVLAWDPALEGTDVVQASVSGLQGIFRDADDRLWAAVSDNIEGALGWLEDGALVELATEAVDGTPIRLPEDVALAPDGTLVAVDSAMATLLLLDPATGATTATPLQIGNPRALCFHDDALHVAGADGVFRVDLPGGEATLLDARPGRGIVSREGILLADNDDDGVFVVGGAGVGGAEIVGPGPMLGRDGILYVSDISGRYLYALDLTGWSP